MGWDVLFAVALNIPHNLILLLALRKWLPIQLNIFVLGWGALAIGDGFGVVEVIEGGVGVGFVSDRISQCNLLLLRASIIPNRPRILKVVW